MILMMSEYKVFTGRQQKSIEFHALAIKEKLEGRLQHLEDEHAWKDMSESVKHTVRNRIYQLEEMYKIIEDFDRAIRNPDNLIDKV